MNDELTYETPQKPFHTDDQVNVMWDITCNHIPHILERIETRLKNSETKIAQNCFKLNWMLVLMGLVFAFNALVLALVAMNFISP